MSFKEGLAGKLEGLDRGELKRKNVVLLPDCYIDRLIYVKHDLDKFLDLMREVALSGGGAIQGYVQEEVRGGNAANTAATLASLGFKPTLICRADEYGRKALEEFFKGLEVELRVKGGEGRSMTVSFEIPLNGNCVNVMFGYPGPLSDFGPECLDPEDLTLIGGADLLGIFNWARNTAKGTELFEAVTKYFKEKGKGVVYADIADPRPRLSDLPSLIGRVLSPGLVDFLSLNESEALTLYGALKGGEGLSPSEAVLCLSERFNFKIVFHTVNYSSVIERGRYLAKIPSFDVKPLRATGAGDVFNGGFIAGILMGLSYAEALLLGNACAGYYLSKGSLPSLTDLIKFLKRANLREEV